MSSRSAALSRFAALFDGLFQADAAYLDVVQVLFGAEQDPQDVRGAGRGQRQQAVDVLDVLRTAVPHGLQIGPDGRAQ
ncbi:hypothetical protein [Streptomyces sanglieri]|uniref:hypothetical protein n=1 Tax=Streptomyces sanglieri TaxID=193460 RepID=UPI003525F214